MFTARDILDRVTKQPFVPMRIITSAGDRYDVFHPDMIMVGRREVTVGTATADNPAVYERQSRVSILHVAAIEDLNAPIHSGSNGEAGAEKKPSPLRGPDTRLPFGSRPSLSVSLAALSTPPSEWLRPKGSRSHFRDSEVSPAGQADDTSYLERPLNDANRATRFSPTIGRTGTISRPAVHAVRPPINIDRSCIGGVETTVAKRHSGAIDPGSPTRPTRTPRATKTQRAGSQRYRLPPGGSSLLDRSAISSAAAACPAPTRSGSAAAAPRPRSSSTRRCPHPVAR